MADGFIYAASCSTLPGFLKVGFTERTPEIRLGELNRFSNIYKLILAIDAAKENDSYMSVRIVDRPIATRWKIVYGRKVSDARLSERILHTILAPYKEHFGSNREIFEVSLNDFRKYNRVANLVKEKIKDTGEEFTKYTINGYACAIIGREDDEKLRAKRKEKIKTEVIEIDRIKSIMISHIAKAHRKAKAEFKSKAEIKSRMISHIAEFRAKADIKAKAKTETKAKADEMARIAAEEAEEKAKTEPEEIFVGKKSYTYQ